MSKRQMYTVTRSVQIEAESPEQAAELCVERYYNSYERDPEQVVHVTSMYGTHHDIRVRVQSSPSFRGTIEVSE